LSFVWSKGLKALSMWNDMQTRYVLVDKGTYKNEGDLYLCQRRQFQTVSNGFVPN
jgi:hypothetical protein